MKSDIASRKDIILLVDEFYAKIQVDDLIGGIFHGVIKNNWDTHLEKMYRFWETVLLENHTYSGAPFMPHAGLPLEQVHFDRWLLLFGATIDEHFAGTVAEDAKARATKMAVMFLSKIEYLRKHGNFKPLI